MDPPGALPRRRARSAAAWSSLAAALLCAAVALGCDDEDVQRVLFVDLVAADGGDPTEGADLDTLVVRVRQGGGEVEERTVALEDPTLDVTIEDLSAPMAITVELRGETARRIGAPPPFVPTEGGGLVRVPVGPPGTCATLRGEGTALEVPREAAGVARDATFALVAGGVAAAGPTGATEAFDLLRAAGAGSIEDLSAPAGRTRAALLAPGRVLLVADGAEPVIYDLSDPERRTESVPLHAGADARSAVLPLPDGGAVVVGGGAGAPVPGVTWVDADGGTRSAELAVPRSHAAAAPLGDLVLVAGGMAAGEPLAELIGRGDAEGRPVVQELDHGERAGAHLAVRGGRAWLLGGTDAGGAPRIDTVLISGCPDACAASGGPAWPDARTEMATVPTEEGVLLVGGSPPTTRVEHARLDAATPTFELAYELAEPRAAAGAIRLEAGVLVALGGRGPGGVLDTVELCWPDMLEL
ncbi:MAG: hypothetical protein ACODAU_12250 [Myxococcota bacterium]